MQTTIALSTTQKRLIQLSFSKALMRNETITEIFFYQLFGADPSLTALFGVPKDEKQQLLFQLMSQVVSMLNEPETLLMAVKKLSHQYRLTPRHYQLFGKVLLSTLEQVLGKTFNTEVKTAWATLYNTLVTAASESA